MLARLRPGCSPPPMPPDLAAQLAAAGVLVTVDAIERRREAAKRLVAIERPRFEAQRYCMLRSLFQPHHAAALGQYYDAVIASGAWVFGDAQVTQRHGWHNEPVARYFHHQLTAFVSTIASQPVLPSYCYVSAYRSGQGFTASACGPEAVCFYRIGLDRRRHGRGPRGVASLASYAGWNYVNNAIDGRCRALSRLRDSALARPAATGSCVDGADLPLCAAGFHRRAQLKGERSGSSDSRIAGTPKKLFAIGQNTTHLSARLRAERAAAAGMTQLAACLREAGHDVDLLDLTVESIRNVDFTRYCLVGMTLLCTNFPGRDRLAKRIRENNGDVWIAAGGPFADACPRDVLDTGVFDLVGHAECETTLPILIDALKRGGDVRDVPGMSFRRDGIGPRRTPNPPLLESLDGLPFPAYDLLSMSRYSRHSIMASRGPPEPGGSSPDLPGYIQVVPGASSGPSQDSSRADAADDGDVDHQGTGGPGDVAASQRDLQAASPARSAHPPARRRQQEASDQEASRTAARDGTLRPSTRRRSR